MAKAGLLKKLIRLEKQLAEKGHTAKQTLKNQVHHRQLASAVNLVQYLLLRRHNLLQLQDALHRRGLSSLASAESHIHRQLQEVLMRLGIHLGPKQLNSLHAKKATRLLDCRARTLFGIPDKDHPVALMVTLDSTIHQHPEAIEPLLQSGMQVARINCAHDDAGSWLGMIKALKQAAATTRKTCSVYMDLAGPKFRITIMQQGKILKQAPIAMHEQWLLTDEGAPATLETKPVLCCQIEGLWQMLQPGNTVLIDDGMIAATVGAKQMDGVLLTIHRISGKPILKSGKGINFPNHHLNLDPLTPDDMHTLAFVQAHADLVGYSFVRTISDLAHLHQHLYHGNDAPKPALIIKIETPEAVYNLPELLLYAMRYPIFGVMIARGDLAVEIGFERMSEIQEEILWICEAAHTPVIWATQVLEQLNKTGVAARSEITDAYKAAQAECIMINKGKNTPLVLNTLRDIIRRSHRHHLKKRYAMPGLSIAQKFSLSQTATKLH